MLSKRVMMKKVMKRVMMVGMALTIGVACNSQKVYRISGSLPNAEEGSLVELTGLNAAGEDSLLNTAKITRGRFEIPVNESCEMVWLRIPDVKREIPVFFEPQVREYRLEADGNGRARISGGALQQEWDDYRDRIAVFESRKDSIEEAYKEYVQKDDLFGKMHLRAVYDDLQVAQEQFEDSLLRQTDNIVAAAIVWMQSKRLAAGQALEEKVALLGEKALLTGPGKAVKQQVDNMIHIKEGKIAPDFTQNDPQGKPVSLYGIKAKLKILDFWASWCGPCRAETPNVRRMYEKYKGAGLEIISVSLDTKRENWLNAIETDGMEWIHTSDLQGWNNAVAKLYGIRSVPAIFVLDENNRIIGQDLRGKELEETIRKALEGK